MRDTAGNSDSVWDNVIALIHLCGEDPATIADHGKSQIIPRDEEPLKLLNDGICTLIKHCSQDHSQ